jgi:hypothetical protein
MIITLVYETDAIFSQKIVIITSTPGIATSSIKWDKNRCGSGCDAKIKVKLKDPGLASQPQQLHFINNYLGSML